MAANMDSVGTFGVAKEMAKVRPQYSCFGN